MRDILKNEARRHNDNLSAISVDRLADVKFDFDKMDIDTSPYYSFDRRTDLGFTARSVLVVASPDRPAFASFAFGGEKKKIIIPPTYIDCNKREAYIKSYLSDILRENGFHIASANMLPCKPIAAHAGLGVYGRNNVIYVDGMGSFHSLHLFFSDIPWDYGCFYPLRRMECCGNCDQCIENCPTGALTHESDVVNIDRCLTHLNEHAGEFPSWLNPGWHNALIGCVKCQYICPQNRKYLDAEREIAHFDEEQTEAFANGQLPDEEIGKLGLPDIYNKLLPRNLKVLPDQPERHINSLNK